MGTVVVRALRVVIVMLLAGTLLIQVGMVAAVISGSDPEDGTLPPPRRGSSPSWASAIPQASWSVYGDWSGMADREPCSPRPPSGTSTA